MSFMGREKRTRSPYWRRLIGTNERIKWYRTHFCMRALKKTTRGPGPRLSPSSSFVLVFLALTPWHHCIFFSCSQGSLSVCISVSPEQQAKWCHKWRESALSRLGSKLIHHLWNWIPSTTFTHTLDHIKHQAHEQQQQQQRHTQNRTVHRTQNN